MKKIIENAPQTNDVDAIYKRLNENIRLLLARYEMYPVDLAVLMGMNKRTFSGRRKAPWTFSLGELELMAKILRTDVTTLLYGDVCPVAPFAAKRG